MRGNVARLWNPGPLVVELPRTPLPRTRVNKAEADVSICFRKRYARWQMHLLASSVTITPWRRIRRRLS
jgi:hypothetical protein